MRLAAHAGQGDGGFAAAVLAAANASDRQQRLPRRLRGGEPVILRDLSSPCDLAPWAEAALRQGYRSMIALPLRADGGALRQLQHLRRYPGRLRRARRWPCSPSWPRTSPSASRPCAPAPPRPKRSGRLRNDAERDARGRLAATLHDGVGQTLQALNLGLKQATGAWPGAKTAVPVELLERLVDEAGDALRELRA